MATRAGRALLSILILGLAGLARADVALPVRGAAADAPLSIGKDGRLGGVELSFEMGKPSLTPTSLRSLDRVARQLKEKAKASLRIEVHTDAQGADEWNLRLSQARADAIADGLVERGVDRQRIEARGFGESAPIASNRTAEGRALNRRVWLFVH